MVIKSPQYGMTLCFHFVYIPIVTLVTWLDFGDILSETFFCQIIFQNFGCDFFKVKHSIGQISGMVSPINVKIKRSASVGYLVNYVTITFNLIHDLDLGFFKVGFRNCCISGIVGLINVKRKGNELINYWAYYMTLPFDHTHDLDLEVTTSKFQIALSKEWEVRLTWNGRDESHPFMTMTLTFVWTWWGILRRYLSAALDISIKGHLPETIVIGNFLIISSLNFLEISTFEIPAKSQLLGNNRYFWLLLNKCEVDPVIRWS